MAARLRSATKITVTNRPNTNVKIGQPASSPNTPKVISGTPGRVIPASTKPISAMNKPMPAPIEYFSASGTAWNTAVRNPVRTKSKTITPSITTRPNACGQVMNGARPKAKNPLSPRPAAIAIGKRPSTPIKIVMMPATSAVAAATNEIASPISWPPPGKFPLMSLAVPTMSGLSTTM